MTTTYPTHDAHRVRAEELLRQAEAGDYAPMNPYRVDLLSRATVHALLAQTAQVAPAWDEAAHLQSRLNVALARVDDAVARADVIEAIAKPSTPVLPNGTTSQPRKRAAKKTTATKETTK